MVRPGGAIAALAGSAALGGAAEPICFEHPIGTLPGAAMTVDLGRNADLVGVEWAGPPVALQLRFRRSRRRLESLGFGRLSAATARMRALRRQRRIGDPVWTGGTSIVQLRAGGRWAGCACGW